MLSRKVKSEISAKIQAILQEVEDDELPVGEIPFILHIDGAAGWSWANIRNNSDKDIPAPMEIDTNLSNYALRTEEDA